MRAPFSLIFSSVLGLSLGATPTVDMTGEWYLAGVSHTSDGPELYTGRGLIVETPHATLRLLYYSVDRHGVFSPYDSLMMLDQEGSFLSGVYRNTNQGRSDDAGIGTYRLSDGMLKGRWFQQNIWPEHPGVEVWSRSPFDSAALEQIQASYNAASLAQDETNSSASANPPAPHNRGPRT